MLTRCPSCRTTFRVTPEQLKARQGKVRCGECQQVFNALDTLIEAPVPVAPTEAALPAQQPAPVEEAAMLAAADAAPPPAQEAAPTIETVDEAASADTAGEPTGPEAEAGIATAEAAVGGLTAATATKATTRPLAESATEPEAEYARDSAGPAPEAASEPASEPALMEPPRRRAWPWLLGVLVALALLALQAAMHFRTELAVLHPETRPWFAAACEIAGCKLSLPRKAELMSIETSDLHPENGGRLGLSATLKNRAPFDQEFPHLEITLTDTADRALVRRVLAPPEYLAATALGAGFGAGRELPVELSVEAADVAAVGYRLYLFYP